MEDLAEVSMEQEFSEPAAEVAAEVQPEELVPEREEPNEETENVPEVSGEEGSALETGAEDSAADFDGMKSRKQPRRRSTMRSMQAGRSWQKHIRRSWASRCRMTS